jgi:hypothetical protein
MSRHQAQLIEQQESVINGLRAQISGLRGELQGVLRGQHGVGVRLAHRIETTALQAAESQRAHDRAVTDVRRLLRLLAEYVVDERDAENASIEALVEAVALAGFPLPTALVAAERAEATASADAHMSAAALASAPVPARSGT